jgi:phosphomannomutase/phosphoglucomutase
MLSDASLTKLKEAKEIFRAYDIRGIYGQTLTPEIVTEVGKALGTKAQELGSRSIIIGRDGRLSSPVLFEALTTGVLSTGCDVTDIGVVASPVLYYAAKILDSNCGVMITGSHNPANYNGLKMVMGGRTLSSDDIKNLYKRIENQNYQTGTGKLSEVDVIDRYIDEIAAGITVSKPLKVVVDAGNGVGGAIAPKLLRKLGCEVVELFCEVDGNFPNHHPDPSVEKNLEDLIKTVKVQAADIGLAFDGDADRLGIITNKCENIWPDRQMMLYAKDVIEQQPGATIIFDVKCTRNLPQKIKEFGGKPLMWKTGHSHIKAKLAETKAPLAGEMSGHTFFNDRWYGFDDGIYTAARLLEIISKDGRSSSEIFQDFPDSVNTPELKLPISEERKFEFMEKFVNEADFGDGNISTIDGVRVDYADSWGLVRPSNTTPYLILRFEADDSAALESIQNRFREQLLRLDGDLKIPF